jgi:hypothetical protein
MFSKLKLILFICNFSVIYSSSESKCSVHVNTHEFDTTSRSLSLFSQYHFRFGSPSPEPDNDVIGYAIDMECFNTLNQTTNRHFIFKKQNLDVEVNVYNCTSSKDLFLKAFEITENDSKQFVFETKFEELPVSIVAMDMKLTMNKRYGGGCLKTIAFSRRRSSVFATVKDLWRDSGFFRAVMVLSLALSLSTIGFLLVILVKRNLAFEKKSVQVNIPLVKFRRQHLKTELDGIENKSSEFTELEIKKEDSEMRGKVEEAVQSCEFQILREQFSQTEPEYLKGSSIYYEYRSQDPHNRKIPPFQL